MADILLVDDSVSMRDMVSFTLKQAGHTLSEAGDGVQALDIAMDKDFDLVITDINMPNMNGIIFTAKLRELDSFKFTPILILTTETGEPRKKEAKEAGATGWIEKPFDPDHLIKTISKVL